MKTPIKTSASARHLESPSADGWKIQAGLRFGLAFIVVCGHLFRFSPDAGAPNKFLMKIGEFDAVAAVICFLIISGYSIANSLERSSQGFYRRRVWRIYPLYICGVLAALVPFWFGGPVISTVDGHFEVPFLRTAFGNLFFLQGFFVEPLSSNRPLWTLAIEVFCYLLAPYFMRMKSWQLVGLILVSAAAFSLHARLHLPFYSALTHGLPVFFLIWAWLSGFLLHRYRTDARCRIFVLTLGVLVLSVNTEYNKRFALFTYVLATIILIFAGELKLPRRLLGWLNYLGEVSYPLYVLHVPIFILSAGVFGITSAPGLVGLALFGAISFYHLVDRPLRGRFKEKKLVLARAGGGTT